MGKRNTIVAGCFFLALTFFNTDLGAQSIKAQALLDSAQISIGDQVKLILRVNYSKNGLFQRADFSLLDSLNGIEIVAVDTPRTRISGYSTTTEQALTLTSFDAGRYTLPAIPLFVAEGTKIDTAWTKELVLEVNDVEVNSDSLHIEPIKDIIPEARRLSDYWPYWGSALLLLLVGGIWYLSNKPVKEQFFPKSVIKRAPHVIALDKLHALQKASPWLQPKALKAYYADLTFIEREYLENRYGIQALESTTGEILMALKKHPIPTVVVNTLRDLLETADMVKFAKASPDAESSANWLERAIEVVEMTAKEENEVTNLEQNTSMANDG